jgi:hypothetical protein
MNANAVIEAYVTDVAMRLPRKQRNDVAFELRALLTEELQARADAAGRSADSVMATELVQAFGRPADVAARSRPTLTIVDPADGPAFRRAALIGLGLIWGMGLLIHLRQPIGSGWDLLTVLGGWWGNTVIPSLWWPGVLVVCFAAGAWARRRWPQTGEWKPSAGDHGPVNRAAMMLALVGILGGVFLLLEPSRVLDVLFGGRAAPAAYEALTYTEAFRRQQAPWVLGLLLLNVPLFVAVIVRGRWSATLRRMELGLVLLTTAMLVWILLDGPVFMTPASDGTTKFFLALIVVVTLVSIGIQRYRSVKPAPSQVPAGH